MSRIFAFKLFPQSMITSETVRQLALALPETMEQPHFEKNAFRINGKIFATHSAEKQQVVVKLNEVDQSVFSAMGKGSCYPVAGGWGKQGWTAIELSSAEEVFFAGCPENGLVDRCTAEIGDEVFSRVEPARTPSVVYTFALALPVGHSQSKSFSPQHPLSTPYLCPAISPTTA